MAEVILDTPGKCVGWKEFHRGALRIKCFYLSTICKRNLQFICNPPHFVNVQKSVS